ncbi:hypothetical protein [Phenylobacterium sp. SCN 70-31]|uniref:hypothetical protein n=1 Tax=Phenylobacterium sp. SCN 70-31 TaxID=1660129 RepID=UPI0025E10203|nr:hypothetical protein [Phenylobacterium sp. SCN 70-31]
MQTETHTTHAKPHKPRHLFERFEGMIGMVMVGAIVLLAIGLIFGIVTTGDTTPKWMQ